MLGATPGIIRTTADFTGNTVLRRRLIRQAVCSMFLMKTRWMWWFQYGEGEALITGTGGAVPCFGRLAENWSQRARLYTIALYEYQQQLLGHDLRGVNGVLVLPPEAYDPQTGLSLEQNRIFWRCEMKNTTYPNIVEFEVTGSYGLFFPIPSYASAGKNAPIRFPPMRR